MKLNKQNKIIVGVLAFLLTLTVGYAVFSQSLNITGTAKAEGNFSLIFSSVGEIKQVGSTGATATRENNNKTLSVNVPNLQYPSAYVEIPAVIKNEGSISAQLDSINTEGLTEDDIKVTYKLLKDGQEINLEENNDVIESGKTRNIIITVKWDENSTKSEVTLENFTISLNYKQYNGSLVDSTEGSNDKYNIGDTISFTNESTGKSETFRVIKDSGTTVTALAENNLMVGYSNDLELIEETAQGYGLQTSERCTIEFANKDENHKNSAHYFGYWTDESGNLLSKYGSSYPVNVYDENSNLYQHLVNYKNYFINTLNKSSVNMRLITYDELVELGCDAENETCDTEIVTTNNRQWLLSEDYFYWTASAGNDFKLFYVEYNGRFESNNGDFGGEQDISLRPVIEINKSEI